MKTATQKLSTFPCTIEVLSPLHIGAGQENALSPYVDFVQRGSTVHYIDSHAIEQALANHSNSDTLITRYVDRITQSMNNNRSEFDLGHFIENDIGIPLEDVTRVTCTAQGDIQRATISSHIASLHRPFIPGSSLKGAIRTALLYHYLTSDEGKETAQKILAVGNRLKDRNGKTISITRSENGHRLHKEALETIKRIDVAQCFTTKLQNPSTDTDELRYLRVTDSNFAPMTALKIVDLRSAIRIVERKNESQTKRKNSIPVWSETLQIGTELAFSLAFLTGASLPTLSAFNKLKPTALFSLINDFSFAAIDRELTCFSTTRQFPHIREFYNTLLQKVEDSPKNTTFLRLGAKKTFFDNSIILALEQYALDNEDKDSTGSLGRLLSLIHKRDITDYNTFPLTRSFVFQNNKPAYPTGWVKITWST